jgi:hypothetical protein
MHARGGPGACIHPSIKHATDVHPSSLLVQGAFARQLRAAWPSFLERAHTRAPDSKPWPGCKAVPPSALAPLSRHRRTHLVAVPAAPAYHCPSPRAR